MDIHKLEAILVALNKALREHPYTLDIDRDPDFGIDSDVIPRFCVSFSFLQEGGVWSHSTVVFFEEGITWGLRVTADAGRKKVVREHVITGPNGGRLTWDGGCQHLLVMMATAIDGFRCTPLFKGLYVTLADDFEETAVALM